MTAYGTVETAVEAMKLGAYDYITKPFSGDELINTIERAAEAGALVKENQILKASGSPRVPARAVANTRWSEAASRWWGSGSGSGRSPKATPGAGHGRVRDGQGSGQPMDPRAQSPGRRAVPGHQLCGTVSQSARIGVVRTREGGVHRSRQDARGRFELADGGTLLLDEISEIAPEIQAKLLRVLKERTFERVGSSTSRSGRRPHHRDLESGPPGRGRGRHVPSGPVLPSECAAAPDPIAPGPRGGHSGTRDAFPRTLSARRAGTLSGRAGRHGSADAVPVAGQRA